jgi:hypothetical protein
MCFVVGGGAIDAPNVRHLVAANLARHVQRLARLLCLAPAAHILVESLFLHASS